ncbi:Major Facilitator Superfamily protein [Paenibacillus sp. yr247]|nr:Major Facilitator Superfamily protein [Paenibacillus sp. yr247]
MNSIEGILIFRAILGLGIGFITPLMNALVAEYFDGEDRSKMNGLTVGVNGLSGAFFLIIGGAITALGWRGVFWTYCLWRGFAHFSIAVRAIQRDFVHLLKHV